MAELLSILGVLVHGKVACHCNEVFKFTYKVMSACNMNATNSGPPPHLLME